MTKGNNRYFEVLMVEDDPGDADLIYECLAETPAPLKLNIVSDGEKAIAYLRQQNEFADANRPDLILLDLNLPRKNGNEVLEEIKRDPQLKLIPVIVLTTSDSDKDIKSSYDLGANCYIIKPNGWTQLAKVVQSIEDFWIFTAKLPSE